MSRLLPRYTVVSHTEAVKVDKAVGNAAVGEVITTKTKATAPGDSRKLRGIPVAGGACGTSPNTDPLAETIRRDEQRRRRWAA